MPCPNLFDIKWLDLNIYFTILQQLVSALKKSKMEGSYYLPTRKAGKRVISGATEEVEVKVETFLNSTKKRKVNHEKAAVNVSTGLEIGGRYHVTEIREVKTKFGVKQIWCMTCLRTGSSVYISAPKSLSSIIGTKESAAVIDRKKTKLLFNWTTVIYMGIEEGAEEDTSPSHIFDYDYALNDNVEPDPSELWLTSFNYESYFTYLTMRVSAMYKNV